MIKTKRTLSFEETPCLILERAALQLTLYFCSAEDNVKRIQRFEVLEKKQKLKRKQEKTLVPFGWGITASSLIIENRVDSDYWRGVSLTLIAMIVITKANSHYVFTENPHFNVLEVFIKSLFTLEFGKIQQNKLGNCKTFCYSRDHQWHP